MGPNSDMMQSIGLVPLDMPVRFNVDHPGLIIRVSGLPTNSASLFIGGPAKGVLGLRMGTHEHTKGRNEVFVLLLYGFEVMVTQNGEPPCV